MKGNLLIVILILLCFSLHSQDYWMGINVPDSVTDINNISITPSGTILICTNLGMYSSLNNGENWEKFGNLDWPIYHIAYSNSAIYADGGYNLFKSINNGQSWDTMSSYTSFNVSLKIIHDSLLFRTNWGGIYKSTDEGITWFKVHDTYTSQCFYDLVYFDGALFSSSVAFMISEDCGVYKSDDWGNSWNLHSLEHYGCIPLLVSNNVMYAGVVGDWPLGSSPGVFLLDTINPSWVNIFSPGEVYCIAKDSIGGIYIGLQNDIIPEWGIRYSNNDGQSWENISEGLPQESHVNRLEVSSADYIYALLTSFNGDTLFRSINPIVRTNENRTGDQFELELFPNPTNNTAELIINSEVGSQITVNLFNIHGQQLQQIEKINRNGKLEILLDFENYLAGNYFISIVNGNKRISKIIQKR